jgi:ubiquinone/menaquinone biosynthesis C-methylase UbiE
MRATIQQHNERPAAVWSSGGPEYDEISRGIGDALEHCVRRLDPRPGERVLDLSTGTGWTSRLMARRGATVVGTDIAAGLLEAARQRAREDRLTIEYQLGDAEGLPFETGSFDAAASTFGVMFASRPEAAAAELARVCRPGGRIALTTWLPDSTVFEMFTVMNTYMPVPLVAAPSPFAWGRQERVRELLGGAFRLRFEPGVSYYREPSPEAAWKTFSTGYGPTRMLAQLLDPRRVASLRDDFIAFHARYAHELGITVPRGYLLTIGERL